MTHKIFISHNHNDKPVVEPVAIRLSQIFGQTAVFYDSWSIQPGDGIIDQMNKGLEAPEFVFFFVSANSLASAMVKLEWQNALFMATKGKTKIIPVRLDGTSMPPLLTQTLYVDMYTAGLEAAITQIVNITQGNASFTPQHQGFSNLSWSIVPEADGQQIIIQASHFMEPNGSFLLETTNKTEEYEINSISAAQYYGGPKETSISDPTGKMIRCFHYSTMGAAITPGHPLRLKIKKTTETSVAIIEIYHEAAEGKWRKLPLKR